jgi:hypothetical protein
MSDDMAGSRAAHKNGGGSSGGLAAGMSRWPAACGGVTAVRRRSGPVL